MADLNHALSGPDLGALLREFKDVDAKAAALLRKNIRNAAKVASEDVKREVLKPPPNDNPKITVGTRDAIAAGISVRINTGANSKSQGVAIVGSSKRLAPERKGMLHLYNKESWRHPVFADSVNGDRDSRTRGFKALNLLRLATGRSALKSWKWEVQRGRPYWGAVLKTHTDDVQRAIQAAVDEANAALLRAK